jgi:predicted porin
MKKSLLALAVLGAFAGAASAQTNVTLYGIVDTAIQMYDSDQPNGDRTGRLISGGQSASRIGFRGTEDLGGGLKANFVLEQGFNSDAGTFGEADKQFSRLAFVGLSGRFGTVSLGKQVMPLKDAHDIIDPFGAAGATGNIENIFYNGSPAASFLPDAGRPINTVKYVSPSFSGLTLRTSYSFGEQSGSTSRNRNLGLGAAYVNGPLNVQFGYADIDTGGSSTASSTAENQVLFLGAIYDLGVAKLHAAFGDYETENAANGVVTLEGRNALIGVTFPFGASSIIATYAKNDVRTAGATGENDSDRLALMYTYDLSKRTNFYVGYSKTSNDAGAILNAGAGGITTPAGGDPQQFNVGVRHRF